MRVLRATFAALLVASVAAVPQVRLGDTTITGTDLPILKQEFFGGLPYAEPPVGQLRLQPPILKTHLNTTSFSAVNFGLPCLQVPFPNDAVLAVSTEDCLTLNVFRPAGLSPNALLPVYVWIHGGGFLSGAAAQYNASALVANSMKRGTPIIYVNMNYRLGPLGFPQGYEAKQKGALNLGLKDQLAGLQWIQENIHIFGGDKDKVTISGQSAGSVSVAIQLFNPGIRKLARAAILESGSAGTVILNPPEQRESAWQDFAVAINGCKDVTNTFQCIRSANTSTLLQAIVKAQSNAKELFPWVPTLDGKGGILPDLPSRLLQQGQLAPLPFIAGTNLDEGTSFVDPHINSAQQIHDRLVANFTSSIVNPSSLDKSIEGLLQLYPQDPSFGSPFNTGNLTFGLSPEFKRAAAISGDVSFDSQRRLLSCQASVHGVKNFAYLFTDPQPSVPPFLGVPHTAELFYVYGALTNATDSAKSLSLNMMDYWISFITSLDPNDGRGSKRPAWPQYTLTNDVLLQLNGANTTAVPDTYRAAQINFINQDPAVWHHRRSWF